MWRGPTRSPYRTATTRRRMRKDCNKSYAPLRSSLCDDSTASKSPSRYHRLTLVALVIVSLVLPHASAQTTPVVPVATQFPSSAPSLSQTPTSSPTADPTTGPTSSPTTLPTWGPTAAPIVSTTNPTTRAPTVVPTSAPRTAAPVTLLPTMILTGVPTQSPISGTRSPVITTTTPTAVLTTLPTVVAPTPLPTLAKTEMAFAALMRLTTMPGGTLQDGQRIDWEAATAAHIREVFKNMQLPLRELTVQTDVLVQRLLQNTAASRVGGEGGGRKKQLRNLQQQPTTESQNILQVDFTALIGFRSERTDYPVDSMILEAFNTEAEMRRYIQRLQDGSADDDETFDYLQTVQVWVEGRAAPPGGDKDETSTKEENDVMLYVIAAAGGGCALVVVGLVFLYCNRKSSRNGRSSNKTPGTPTKRKDDMTMTGSDKSPLGLAADIVVNRTNDDVSTLGDPVLITTQPTPLDEQTASVGNDYDYAREYRRAHGIPSDTGSLERNESVGSRTANSASFFSTSENSLDFMLEGDPRLVHRFEVMVPPGKLGIVMDNSPSGTPMVFAVKPESVLASQVQIGDRLLSVDQEDVTVMSAIQVSKLISLKADQERTLMFCRKRSSENAQDL